jgi:hypothetical protein
VVSGLTAWATATGARPSSKPSELSRWRQTRLRS